MINVQDKVRIKAFSDKQEFTVLRKGTLLGDVGDGETYYRLFMDNGYILSRLYKEEELEVVNENRR